MAIVNSEEAEYDFPEDLEEAETMLRDVQADVIGIQTQLGNRNRQHPDGSRFTDEEYWEWRHRAAGALHHRLEELRELKAHVKTLRREKVAARSANPATRTPLMLVDELVTSYREGDTPTVMVLLADLANEWQVRS